MFLFLRLFKRVRVSGPPHHHVEPSTRGITHRPQMAGSTHPSHASKIEVKMRATL